MSSTFSPHSRIRRFATDRRATSAVEFAILSPLFFLLLTGIAAYGIYFGASHSVQQLAADTARAAIAGLDADERQSIAAGFLERNAGGYTFVDPARLSVDVGDSDTEAGVFSVAVRYDARQLPIWNLLRDLPLPGMTIARRSVIRIGGV